MASATIATSDGGRAECAGQDHRLNHKQIEETSTMRNGIFHLVTATTVAIALSASSAYAQKKYDTGATDTEIKIGQTNPFWAPLPSYATIGKTQAAYMKMINDQGGVNGRKINLIQYDDAYSPPKRSSRCASWSRATKCCSPSSSSAPPSNAAVQKYLNAQEGAAAVRRHRRVEVHRPEELPVDDGLQPQLLRRRPHLRPVHPEGVSERQDRHPLSERRPRQGLS